MEPTKPFDLGLAVETYLNKINDNLLLDGEEMDELRDHLYCAVEELMDKGLDEIEAFEVSKIRLGKQVIIQEEFKKIKPKHALSRYLIAAIFLLFFTRLVISSFNFMSELSVLLIGQLGIDLAFARYFDFGLKALLITLISWRIWSALQKERINKILLFCIPILSLFADVIFLLISNVIFNNYDDTYVSYYGRFERNSNLIIMIFYLFLIGLYYFLWQNRTPNQIDEVLASDHV